MSDHIHQTHPSENNPNATSIIAPSRLAGAVLLLASSLTVLAGAIMTPSVQAIQKHFSNHLDHAELLSKLVLTVPAIAIALTAPFAGWLADRFGRLRLLWIGLIGYALAGTTGLWLDNLYMILVGRLALGLSVAAIMTAATTLISDYYQHETRTRFLGMQSAAMSLSGMVFLMTGGLLATLTWRGPFAVYAVSIFLVPLVWLSLKEPQQHSQTLIAQGDSATRIAWPQVILVNMLAFTGMMLFYMIPTDIDTFLESRFGHSPLFTAIAMSLMTIAGTAISLLFSRLHRWLNHNLLSVIMYAFMGLGMLMLGQATQRWMVLLALLISGFGVGMIMPNCNVWISHLAPLKSRGRLIGALTAFIFLGQFLSPALSAPIVHYRGHGGLTGLYGIAGMISFSFMLLMLIRTLISRDDA